MIYLRHRYTTQPAYDYSLAAWVHRPGLGGPNKPVQMEDEQLQRAMDRAHKEFGTPGLILEIPDTLPTPSARTKLHGKGIIR